MHLHHENLPPTKPIRLKEIRTQRRPQISARRPTSKYPTANPILQAIEKSVEFLDVGSKGVVVSQGVPKLRARYILY